MLFAQTPDTAILRGRVTDQMHAPIAGVDIKVINSLTGAARAARTDTAGDFTIGGLPIAPNYTITADKQGFAQTRSRDISLGGGTPESLLRTMGFRNRKEARTGMGLGRGLRRVAHPAHQSPAGRGSAGAIYPHRAGSDAQRPGCQLHASLLDLVV